jgi:hypothetical protein
MAQTEGSDPSSGGWEVSGAHGLQREDPRDLQNEVMGEVPGEVVGQSDASSRSDHARKTVETVGFDERRDSPRVAISAQLVVVWRDAAQMAETHKILDYGLGGFRLRAMSFVPVGRIGRAVHMLPDRVAVDLDVVVVWSVARPDSTCDFGVRLLEDERWVGRS